MKCRARLPRWLLLLGMMVMHPTLAGACTAFALVDSTGVWVGKNLDWEMSDGLLITHPADPASGRVHASVTFNQFGAELPAGGMNAQGLVVEQLSFTPSVYPAPGGLPTTNEFRIIQELLDRCSTVDSALETLTRVAVQKQWLGLHYFLADRSGTVAVVEYLEGRQVVHRGQGLPIPALVNNTYANSCRYLSRHQGFGGTRQETDGPESPERFVRVARRLKGWKEGAGREEPGEYAFATLDLVRQPDTRWSVLYDPCGLQVRFRVQGSPQQRMVSWDKVSGEFSRCLDLTGSVDSTARETWQDFSPEHERRLRRLTLQQLGTDPGTVYSATSKDSEQKPGPSDEIKP